MSRIHHLAVGLVIAGALLAGRAGQAYEIKAGDQVVRAGAGGSFNFVRHRLVTRETPQALATLGLVYDYALTDSFSVTGALRPGVADRYLDLPLAAGVRYRFPGLKAPLIPYAGAELVVDLGVPLGPPPLHVNLGVRAAGGLEYFVTGNFGVGVEFGLETGPLLTPAFDVESAAELALVCGYRF
ncbi:MAG: hypothetical protein ABIJ09_19755 [Pseudomonadota bacterium]